MINFITITLLVTRHVNRNEVVKFILGTNSLNNVDLPLSNKQANSEGNV